MIGLVMYIIICFIWWVFSVKISCYRSGKKMSFTDFLFSILNFVFCPLSMILAIKFVKRDFIKY